MSQPTPPAPVRKSNRETVLLLIVLGIGLIGLAGLYFSRQSAARAAERALLQAKSAADAAADPQASQAIQRIPGDLLRSNKDSEVGTPYTFVITNFAQGATYEIDPGDGSGRQAFVNGKLKYTYRKTGEYTVRLFARYQGQEALIDSILQKVGQPISVPAPARLYSD